MIFCNNGKSFAGAPQSHQGRNRVLFARLKERFLKQIPRECKILYFLLKGYSFHSCHTLKCYFAPTLEFEQLASGATQIFHQCLLFDFDIHPPSRSRAPGRIADAALLAVGSSLDLILSTSTNLKAVVRARRRPSSSILNGVSDWLHFDIDARA